MILLPTMANKLLMKWKGPYKIVQKLGYMNYIVEIEGKTKTLPINLLKKYVETDEGNGILSVCAGSLINLDDEDTGDSESSILLPQTLQTKTYREVNISDDITPDQQLAVRSLCESFQYVLTDVPGTTNLVEHSIELTTTEPVRLKQYPLPFHTEQTIQDEVEKKLQLKVIDPNCAPVVIARKKDGTNRLCVDFRRLNSVTVFD